MHTKQSDVEKSEQTAHQKSRSTIRAITRLSESTEIIIRMKTAFQHHYNKQVVLQLRRSPLSMTIPPARFSSRTIQHIATFISKIHHLLTNVLSTTAHSSNPHTISSHCHITFWSKTV